MGKFPRNTGQFSDGINTAYPACGPCLCSPGTQPVPWTRNTGNCPRGDVVDISPQHPGRASRLWPPLADPSRVEPSQPVTISGKMWCLPETFIFGKLLAVIGAASNARQSTPDGIEIVIMGEKFKLNTLWGRADVVRQIMKPSAP